MISGAIFDLDGTLLDSMHVWDTLGEEYLRRKGVVPPANLREILRPISMVQTAEYFRSELHITDSESTIIDEINSMVQDKYFYEVPLKPHVDCVLQKLKQDHVKLCVATATDRPLAEAALKRLGVMDYFDFILTCTEAGQGKDNPKFFYDALQRLGTEKEETIVFEDAVHAVETAARAGFRIVGIWDESAQHDRKTIESLTERYLAGWEEY